MNIYILFLFYFATAFDNFAYFDGVKYGVIEDVTSSLAASCDTTGKFLNIFGCLIIFNPQAPIAQKSADEVVFRRFQGEGVEFFLNRTSLTRFKPDLSPSRFHFSVGFISRSYFESDGFIPFSNE